MKKNYIKNLFLGALIGGILLSLFSAFQKASLNVNIFMPQGYIVPLIFGSCSGGIIGILIHKRKKDLQEKLRLEKELSTKLDAEVKRKTRDLENTKELLELLYDTLTHDILNNLSAIRGDIKLYLKLEKEKLLHKIRKATETSIRLVKKMRKLKKVVGADKELKSMDLNRILEDLKKKYSLNIDVQGNAKVLADEMLTSVFDNLIHNVKDHAKTERIKIRIESSKDPYATIIFKDYGIGIPEYIRENVFSEGIKSKETGNWGLGLYIVKKTIERYGGSIKLVNPSQQGTTFHIKLRRAEI